MAASSIEISFMMQGGDSYQKGVTGLAMGNMVDPTTGASWYQPPAVNPWSWENEGKNIKTFAMMANYQYKGTEATAFSQVVIDPGAISEGAHKVVAVLETAMIGGSDSNEILRFKGVTLDGEVSDAVSVTDWGNGQQPASVFAPHGE